MSFTATQKGRIGTPGGDVIAVYDVSPDSASGNITINDVDYAYVLAVCPLIEAPTATTDSVVIKALENSTTKNQIDITLWASSYVAATTYKDFRLTLLLKDTAI